MQCRYKRIRTCSILCTRYLQNRLMFSDERLLEYDIDNVLFDEQSPFQRVQIVHSKTLGNMLVLDDLQSKLTASWHNIPTPFFNVEMRYEASVGRQVPCQVYTQ